MSARLLCPATVAAMLDWKVQTLAIWRMQGRGPQFVKLGPGPGARVGYRMEDVQRWLDELPTFANTLAQKANPGGEARLVFRPRDSRNEFAVIADDTMRRFGPDEGCWVLIPVSQEGLDVTAQGDFGRETGAA
jgi:hypothetical protein